LKSHSGLIVIGNGMAGVATIEEILKKPSPPAITVFGGEPHVNYNRILLSDVLACAKSPGEIYLNSREWYKDNDIQLRTGIFITDIDVDNRQVVADSGERYGYDNLLIATGSDPFIPPVKGTDKDGVMTFRNLGDTLEIIERAKTAQKAVVIGGGLLGLEAARGLINRGLEVTVVHLVDRLMEQQLDAMSGGMLKREIEKLGITVALDHCADEILGNGRVEGVRFTNGRAYEADLVLISTGIRPRVDLAKKAGLGVGRGILVNDYMETTRPGIYAVGECMEHRKRTYGLVAPIMEQTKVAADAIAGNRNLTYEGSIVATTLKVAGVHLTSMGNFMADGAGCEEISYIDAAAGVYKKAVLQGNRVVGTILLGDTKDGPRILQCIKDKTDVALFRNTLLAGGNGKAEEPMRAASMNDEDIVCGCMGVNKKTIVEAIQDNELTSREAVGEATRACTSCKGCGPMVDQLLQEVLGGRYAPAPRAAHLCSCAEMSREALRQVVREKELKTYSAVKQSGCLGDCGACKPAVSYLLSEVWPVEYTDERHARFINDRVHANIQNDGTFSVVPRIYGGVTSPGQLRKIADAAEKYKVPMIKITGGQRLDLLGVQKEDLPRIWADLDMPSGHAYAKAVRTVKTCVGTEFCRFGVGDSTALGIEMEKLFEGLYTPHKVKMAVSGCPRNCAESYVKDIGVVAIEGGWEIYVGGAAGMKVRKGDLLCRVETGEEALEAATRFLQYYRENGEYLERTYDFVERIGVETIRRIIFDRESGEPDRLMERFREAKSAVVDPWRKEGIRPVHKRQFKELEAVVEKS
jgi:nitrite reductase (NADH) large subunit